MLRKSSVIALLLVAVFGSTSFAQRGGFGGSASERSQQILEEARRRSAESRQRAEEAMARARERLNSGVNSGLPGSLPGALPPGAFPPGSYPPGGSPSGAIPSGSGSPGNLGSNLGSGIGRGGNPYGSFGSSQSPQPNAPTLDVPQEESFNANAEMNSRMPIGTMATPAPRSHGSTRVPSTWNGGSTSGSPVGSLLDSDPSATYDSSSEGGSWRIYKVGKAARGFVILIVLLAGGVTAGVTGLIALIRRSTQSSYDSPGQGYPNQGYPRQPHYPPQNQSYPPQKSGWGQAAAKEKQRGW